MTHVFIAPHPDDVALSCGGLVACLRELGQSVTILSVYSGGHASSVDAGDYQRQGVGFGTKTLWPNSQAFDGGNIAAEYPVTSVVGAGAPWQADPARITVTQERANTQARQFWQRAAWTRSANITNESHPGRPLSDDVSTQGAITSEPLALDEPTVRRKAEDERYAWFAEVALVDLDLPDAVHRGYEGEEVLLGPPAEGDEPPAEILRREILRLEPQHVYVPAAVGGHVDHRLCRDAAISLLAEEPGWVMPSPTFVGRLSFYEDFPYAWWSGETGLEAMSSQAAALPEGCHVEARYADVSDQLERKVAGLRLYASQVQRLFDDEQAMLDAVTSFAARVAEAGRVGNGAAERYWAVVSD